MNDPLIQSDQSGFERSDTDLADIIADYLDRLNTGDNLDPAAILAEHPDRGPRIVATLQEFVRLEAHSEENESLGTLGDYTLRRQIGRGGMGVVYEAWEGSMDRRVALKVLPAGIAADERAVGRFVREAQLAGRLNHPNVVSVHGMGVTEETPYYAMEYVEGETLAQVLANVKDAQPDTDTPFGKKDQVGYFAAIASAFGDVADGLQHAHSKKVIHRDIKPSNLILDREGRLRILDFGLAQLEGQEGLTLSGELLGTPQYMSPEQARRKKIEVDHRTDVYSLGATMYEVLCGRPPFRGKDHTDTLSQIIERDPVQPRKLNSRVPRDFETIVLKCLRKDSGDRYGTAEAMGQDLRRLVRGEVIEARAPGKWEQLVCSARHQRNRLLMVTTFILVLCVIAWLAMSRELSEIRRRRAEYGPRVLDALGQLHGRRYRFDEIAGIVGDLNGVPSVVRASDLDGFDATENHSEVTRALASLEDLAKESPDRKDAPFHLGRAYAWLGKPENARLWLERTLRIDPRFVPAITLLHELTLQTSELPPPLFLDERGLAEWEKAWVRGREFARRSQWQNAAQAQAELIHARIPEEPWIGFALDTHLESGLAFLRAHDYTRAQHSFAIARHLSGRLEPALLLAWSCFRDGKSSQGKAIFNEVFACASLLEKPRVSLWIVAVNDSRHG